MKVSKWITFSPPLVELRLLAFASYEDECQDDSALYDQNDKEEGRAEARGTGAPRRLVWQLLLLLLRSGRLRLLPHLLYLVLDPVSERRRSLVCSCKSSFDI